MKHLLSICVVVFLGLFCASCSKKVEKFGDIPSETSLKTPINTILLLPNEYVGKEVVIEGVIASECPTGGWLRIQDSTGHTIYVELHQAEFAPLPQRSGSKAIVKGIVFQESGSSKEVQILGKGVLIQ